MILTDELYDRLCAAAHEKSKELGVDISFAVCDEHGLPRVYRRYGEALVLRHHTGTRKSIHRGRNAVYNERCGCCRSRRSISYGDPDQRSQDHAGCRRIPVICKWKNCRRHRSRRRYRRAGLRHRRICDICFQRAGKIIREFEKGEERSSLFLCAHFSPEYANKLLT